MPLILWSEKQQVLKRCQWNYLFSANEREVDLYMFCVLTLPTVTTTFLYGVLSLKLRKVRNFVHPVTSGTVVSTSKSPWSNLKEVYSFNKTETLDAPTTDVKLSNENLCHITELSSIYASKQTDECSNVRKQFLSDVTSKTVNKSETCTEIKGPLPDADGEQKFGEQEATLTTEKTKHEITTKLMGQTSNRHELESGVSKANAPVVGNSDETLVKASQLSSCNSGNQLSAREDNRKAKTVVKKKTEAVNNRTIRMNKVIKTIGVLLILINISNLPYIVILAMNAVSPGTDVPGVVGVMALFFLMLNSACNPIIYAVRLKPLRVAFLNMFKKCCNFMCKNSCKNT